MEPNAVVALTAAENRQLVGGIVSLAFGVLIFMFPRLLSYIVAAYLVLVGVVLIAAALS